MISLSKKDPVGVLIVVSVVIVVFLLGYLSVVAVRGGLINLPTISLGMWPGSSKVLKINPDAIYLTGPILSIPSAKISRINNTYITITVPKLFGTPSAEITMKIFLDGDTEFLNTDFFVPYAFKERSEASEKSKRTLSLSDFKAGDDVSVVLKEDIRFSDNEMVRASQIAKLSGNNIVDGVVTSVGVDSFVVSSKDVDPKSKMSPRDGVYKVTIIPTTELLRYVDGKPELIGLSELRAGSFVTVYVESTILGNTIDGGLIVLEPSPWASLDNQGSEQSSNFAQPPVE